MVTAVEKFGPIGPIQSHAWSGNKQCVALSHNDKNVVVYQKNQEGWRSVTRLEQHDLRVTGIDWAPISNRIVTCSSDRNAYVWVLQEDGTWKYTLVLLRINRAATCVKWSPQENKFAVGSGARIISICYYEEENDWWVAKHIKKPLRSTITTVDWHPNNVLLAAGSTDFKVRIFSAYIKDIEQKPSGTDWGSKMPFANLMAEFSNSLTGGGWIHSVSFSSDGDKVAWVGHDSSIAVASAKNGMAMMKLKTNFLPLLSITWISSTSLLAGGHDCVPVIFQVDPVGNISGGVKLEEDKKVEPVITGAGGAMRMFRNKDRVGQEVVDSNLNTTHQNQITDIRILGGSKSSAESVSTTAGDGRLCIWDLKSLSEKIANLKV